MDNNPPGFELKPPLVLALDIGTTSTRALLFDGAGRMLPGYLSRRRNLIRQDRSGEMTANADALLEKAWSCIDETLHKAGLLAREIGAVCCDTFASNVLGLDAQGRAITALVLYGDTRAAPQAEALRSRLDEDYFHQRTGARFHSSYLPARFLWWQQTRPDEFAQVQHWVSLGEYFLLKLFGSTAVSYSIASWTGLLDRARLTWDEELLRHLPVRQEQLSALVDANHAWYELQPRFAARWPALGHIPWFPAIGDGAAANMGSGCVSPGRVAISMGTSSAVRTVVTNPHLPIPSGLWCYRVDGRRLLLGGAMTEGGSVYDWFKRCLNLRGLKDLDAALAQMPAAASGLAFLPLISGERSPGWNSDARGILMGLSIATTPLEMLRAGLEGVACRIALVYNLLCQSLPAQPEIIASGGAIQNSPAWQQILADALGYPLRLAANAETSTRGAALLALEALGAIPDLAALPDESILAASPVAEHHTRYQVIMEQQRRMYDELIQGNQTSSLPNG